MRTARVLARTVSAVAALLALASFEAPFEADRNGLAPLLDGFGSVAKTTDALRARADAERAWSDADPPLRRLVLR